MRGVSERVGGRAGWAAESSRGALPFSGRPGTGPAPRSPRRGEARRQLGPPGIPLPNSWPHPGGLQAERGGGVARGLLRPGHAQLALFRAPAAGGGRGRAEPPGRAAGGPRGVPRTKGDGDGSSVVKTTCAGGGPRSGRGLGALRLNPFPAAAAAAAASALRLAADDRAGLARSLLGAGSGPQRAEAGRAPATPLSRPSPPPARASSCPAPFPPGFPVDLPTHCYVRLGGVGAPIRPDRSRRRFHTPPPLQLGFCRRALRSLHAGERGASSRRAPAQVWPGLTHTPPLGLDSLRTLPPLPRARPSPVCTPSV